MREDYDAIVIGGGFFGCSLAATLGQLGKRVLLLEQEPDLLQRASLINQARVHNGYHYPRHFLTASRSNSNFQRFTRDYSDCIVSSFEKYYAVARKFSKTNARQFQNLFQRIGAPVKPAPAAVSKLFNPELIEAVFSVQEYAFDASILKKISLQKLDAARVEVALGTKAERIALSAQGRLVVSASSGGTSIDINAHRVFNCTYANLNAILHESQLELIPLKYEITEMCLVETPEEFENRSVTVMCGPFFSLMPYPTRGQYTLSHVRYTPHYNWKHDGRTYLRPYEVLESAEKRSNFEAMMRDAARYVPCLKKMKYKSSLWEVKTTLPMNETNDGRPILFKPHHGLRGLACVLGGKIDNIYDIQEELISLENLWDN